VRIVLRKNVYDLLAGGDERAGDVSGKRQMAAFMRGNPMAVDPDRRAIVHRAEMRHHAVVGLHAVELAFIPAPKVKSAVVDAPLRRLRRKGDIDPVGPFTGRVVLSKRRSLSNVNFHGPSSDVHSGRTSCGLG
jgi:hypothetical protein